MRLQFLVKRGIHPIQFTIFGDVRTQKAIKAQIQTAIHVIHQLDWRRLHPATVFNHLIQHINRSEEHTSELQSLMRISYAVFCLKKKTKQKKKPYTTTINNN